jgi:16S rRNA (adenine1518-N6/adenine1519-N6)-dimethyltransferase
MQTKQYIKALLQQAGVSPNKRLGQHFLIDLNLMHLLINSARLTPEDVVLEVGCGTGSLTEALAEHAGKVIAVEIDPVLAEIAQVQLASYPHVYLLHTDVLANKNTLHPTVTASLKDARAHYPGRLLLVANLPYEVACPVMLNLLKSEYPIHEMIVTVQKEVAERMVAHSGTGRYGTLSILLGATGTVRRLRVLKPTVFWPPPQVDSAMVTYTRDKEKVSAIRDMNMLFDVIELCMGHRRKMLKSAVRTARGILRYVNDWEGLFQCCGIDSTQRPDTINPGAYVALSNRICAHCRGISSHQ